MYWTKKEVSIYNKGWQINFWSCTVFLHILLRSRTYQSVPIHLVINKLIIHFSWYVGGEFFSFNLTCCYEMKFSKSNVEKQSPSALYTLSKEEKSMEVTDFECKKNRSTKHIHSEISSSTTHSRFDAADCRRSTRSSTNSSFFHLQMASTNIIQGNYIHTHLNIVSVMQSNLWFPTTSIYDHFICKYT